MAPTGRRFQRHPAWGFLALGLPAMEDALRDKEMRVAADRLYMNRLVIASSQFRPVETANGP